MRFRNERTLHSLGLLLKINRLMIPVDTNHALTKEDIKESVEALLYVSYQTNGHT
ncbi:MAG: hypothetical protein ACXADY_20675 [Candidatus Hodarchaeales archaeon]|jgi:hypothetical protein